VAEDDTVLEVGPGLGTLTSLLCAQAKQVIAVEFDDDLARGLAARVQAANLKLVRADILKFDFSTLPAQYKVAANIPYYLTSKLVRLLLEATNPPAVVALLVQKEVAERIAAAPGNMSILSVSVQFYAVPKLYQVVPASLFTPPPKVDSQIIQLVRRDTPLFTDIQPQEFFAVVRAGFGEKRKKLRNSLSGGLRMDKAAVDALLSECGIAENARAEELTMEQWHSLASALKK
jgi:16S rRNA (adenine1518-N6/adenine1519-N6)-dimethyltransferase